MFKIGEFSKLCRVSTSVLRYYDEIGLFKPRQVDRFTGYRYYTLDQLPHLNRILVLRDLDLSLTEIDKIINEEIGLDEIKGMLRLKKAQLAEQQAEIDAKLRRISSRIHQIENEDKMPDYEVIVKRTEPMKIASVREIVPSISEMPAKCGAMFEAVGAWLYSNEIAPIGPAVAIYYDAEYVERDIDVENGLVIPSNVEKGNFSIGIHNITVHDLPVGELVTSIVLEKTNNLIDAWQALAKWIVDNKYEIVGPPSREFYLGPPGEDQLAEIQYFIQPLS